MSDIQEIWKTEGKNLNPPSIYFAEDKSSRKFFVIKDHSYIIYMVLNGSNNTYCIPKKYTRKNKNKDEYIILESNKLLVVSCPSMNEYEIFVQKYLIK